MGIKKTLRKLFKDKRIACLELTGIIAENRKLSNAPQLLAHLDDVEDQEFKVILLAINSPGGTVGMSQAIYERLCRLRQEKGVHVIAYCGDVCASGGVYIAMAADHIISHGGTVTGSIGVIIKSGNYRRLLDKIGIQSEVVKSGEFKDIMSHDRALTDAERALLQSTIDDTYQQFIAAVAQGRQLDIETIKAFADGRIFTGQQAKAYGLVDAVGGKSEAIDQAKAVLGLPKNSKPKLVTLQKKKSVVARLLSEDVTLSVGPQSLWPNSLEAMTELQSALSGIPLWLMPQI